MGSGKQQQPTQTTTYQLAPEQRQILNMAMPGLESFAAKVPQRYGGSTVAGFDPLQTQGQGQVLSSVPGMEALAGGGASASNMLLNDPWNPASNEILRNQVDAAVRPITENYQQVVRPVIRDEFLGAGQQFGGSRRGVAEGNAANAYMRNVGDTSAKLVGDQYATNIGAQVRALGLLPQTMQSQAIPGMTTSGVGDVRQALSQEMLNANVAGFNYDQLAPFLQSKELISLLQGIPGAGVTSTANVPQASKGQTALGGAMAGASMGSMFGPWGTAAGAGLGGLMAFL